MLIVPKMLRVCAVLLVAGAVAACDIETTLSDEDKFTGEAGDDAGSIAEKFIAEPYGIGASWFTYSGTTHSLLPRARVYRLEQGEKTTLFKLDSYYNERGDSGHFSLTRQVIGEADARRFEMTSNVKEDPVCVNLGDAVETDCAAAQHDLVFRVEYRQVAPAGFAVVNPVIYVASHFSDGDDVEILRGEFDSLQAGVDAVDDASAWTRYKDAKTHRDDAILGSIVDGLEVGDASPAFLQASSAMQMIGWTMEKTGERAFNFAANCVKLRMRPGDQTLPLSSDAKSAALEFEPNRVTLLSLCAEDGPAVVEVSAQAYRGLWPASDTYDLAVDTFGGTPVIRVAPGHFAWSTGADSIEASQEIAPEFWDNDDIY